MIGMISFRETYNLLSVTHITVSFIIFCRRGR